ncbi:hypothetical protein R3P38DRAFT_3221638 [Favolaschia claudopus]|uniref:Uncharacterized protein n=1 Tax=Favolaschia claudopus TaxID=2862362 RepID=A0AAW0A0V9_9AGAR
MVGNADKLTPVEIAALIHPADGTRCDISVEVLDALISDLDDTQCDVLLRQLGLTVIAANFGTLLPKFMRHDDDDELDLLVRKMPLFHIAETTPPSPTPSTYTPSPYDYHITTAAGGSSTAHGWLSAGAATSRVPGGQAARATPRSSPSKPSPAAYAVFFGNTVGVFTPQQRSELQDSLRGAKPALHVGFPSIKTADRAIAHARKHGWTSDTSSSRRRLPSTQTPSAPPPQTHSTWFRVGSILVSFVHGSRFFSTLQEFVERSTSRLTRSPQLKSILKPLLQTGRRKS